MAAIGTQLRSPHGSRNGGVSRLSMMQEKFRQQLMIEKESRLLDMAARQDAEREEMIHRVTKTSAGSSLSSSMSSMTSIGTGQGRVRKMFEERRTNSYGQNSKGFDKSYPLEPVKRDSRPPVTRLHNGRGASMDRNKSQGSEQGYMNRSRSQAPIQRVNRGDDRLQKPPKLPPGRAYHKSTSSLVDGVNLTNGRSRGPSPAVPSSTKSSPGPRVTPVKPPRQANKPSSFRLPQSKSENNFLGVQGKGIEEKKPTPSPTNNGGGFFAKLGIGRNRDEPIKKPPGRPAPKVTPKPTPKPKTTMNKAVNGIQKEAKAPVPRGPPPGNLKTCHICGRHFAPDRIEKHEVICAKNQEKAKKRKVFDPTKMRTVGTDAEKYIKRGDHLKENKKVKKANWRKKHEDFIATIRAAKGIKGYEAPPLDVSDYVDCPHCGRKFSEQVAERHIPKCANITCNKSKNMKPGARRR